MESWRWPRQPKGTEGFRHRVWISCGPSIGFVLPGLFPTGSLPGTIVSQRPFPEFSVYRLRDLRYAWKQLKNRLVPVGTIPYIMKRWVLWIGIGYRIPLSCGTGGPAINIS